MLAESSPPCISLCHGLTWSYPGQPQLSALSPLLVIKSMLLPLGVFIRYNSSWVWNNVLSYLNEIPDNNKKAKERKSSASLYDKGHCGGTFSTDPNLPLLMRQCIGQNRSPSNSVYIVTASPVMRKASSFISSNLTLWNSWHCREKLPWQNYTLMSFY